MDFLKSKTGNVAQAANTVDPDEAAQLQHKTRRLHEFGAFEDSLPDLRIKDASSFATHVLSHLGSLNPKPIPLSPSDTVWLFDNTAFRSPLTGKWQTEFVAAYWATEGVNRHGETRTGDVAKAVADVAEKLGIAHGSEEERTIATRLAPFVWEIAPGREVTILPEVMQAESGPVAIDIGPGGRNAISSDVRKIPHAEGGSITTTSVDVPQGTGGILESKTAYAETEGWGVISDIDDTIKLTQTSSPLGILTSTFLSEPTPIAGMPQFYSSLKSLLGPTAPFIYLSASPYNLYSFLRSFRDQHYPHGTIILRDASWMNLGGLLSNLTLGTREYKVDRMKKLQSWLPRRKWVCVGDSTQTDPEAYGDIFRAFPGWIKLILIRKVTDIAAVGLEEKNAPERFEKAFEGVPRNCWHVFEDPNECEAIAERAVAGA